MPKKAAAKKKPKKARAKKQTGAGFLDFLSGVNGFLKQTKLISGLAGVASAIPGLGAIAAPIAGVSGALGYGKKRAKPKPKKKVMKGRGLSQPGGSLRLVGGSQVNQMHPMR